MGHFIYKIVNLDKNQDIWLVKVSCDHSKNGGKDHFKLL
jgi:hypothetical protein